MTKQIVRMPGEGMQGPITAGFGSNQSEVLIKLGAADGAGLGITEYAAPVGYAPPPILHRHTREDAGFYVLEGELGFTFDDSESIMAPAGTLVWLPKHSWFRWWVNGQAPARFLGLFQPSGFEQFFVEVERRVRDAVDDGQLDRETISEIMTDVRQRFGDEQR